MAESDVEGGAAEAWSPPHEAWADSPLPSEYWLQRRIARAERLLLDNCPDYRKYKELQRKEYAEAREAAEATEAAEAREAADSDVGGSDGSGVSDSTENGAEGAEAMADSEGEVGGSSDGSTSAEAQKEQRAYFAAVAAGAEGAEATAESEVGGRAPFGEARKEQRAYFAAAAAGASAADVEKAPKRQKTHGPMTGVNVMNAVVARTDLTLAQVQSVYKKTQEVVIEEIAYKQLVIIPDLVVLYCKDQPATKQREIKVFGEKKTIAAKPAKKEVLATACKLIRECVCTTCGHPKLLPCHSHC